MNKHAPFWVYAGLLWLLVSLSGLSYLMTQHVARTEVPAQEPHRPALTDILQKNKTPFSRQENQLEIVTKDVNSILKELHKNRIQLTECHIIAKNDTYTIKLETQP